MGGRPRGLRKHWQIIDPSLAAWWRGGLLKFWRVESATATLTPTLSLARERKLERSRGIDSQQRFDCDLGEHQVSAQRA